MGKPIVRDFTQGKGILKFFPYEGAACLVPQTMVTSADGTRLWQMLCALCLKI